MDVICKCGHGVKEHKDVFHVILGKGKCDCRFTEEEVYLIHITEQQARLDTNRAQVQSLIYREKLLQEKLNKIQAELNYAIYGVDDDPVDHNDDKKWINSMMAANNDE